MAENDRTSSSSEAAAQPAAPKAPAARAKKKKPFFLKQANMKRVVYALTPLLISAIYFFGWRALAVTVVVYAAAIVTEYIMASQRKQPVSMACFVTAMLFALSLPPTVPYYVAIVGIVVGILFGKEVFGGFGRNFANPAIVGRAFVYVCFPIQLTGQFVPAFRGFPGGFAHWSMEHTLRSSGKLPEYIASAGGQVTDAVSQASPMWVMREAGRDTALQAASYWDLLLGRLGGVFQMGGETRVLTAGSMGEGCAVLILLAAIYLLVTKTANWRLMLSALIGLAFANTLFRHVMGYSGIGGVPPVLFNLLAGTTLYVLVFMVTDPVSAPKRTAAQWAYGLIIGFNIVFLRWKGVFVAAASFSILIGNLLSPLLDMGADYLKARRKARAEAARPKAAPARTHPASQEGGG